MKFRFIGDPANGGDGPDMTTLHGVDFPKGQAVTVASEALMALLAGNSHFEAVKTRQRKAASDGDTDGPAEHGA